MRFTVLAVLSVLVGCEPPPDLTIGYTGLSVIFERTCSGATADGISVSYTARTWDDGTWDATARISRGSSSRTQTCSGDSAVSGDHLCTVQLDVFTPAHPDSVASFRTMPFTYVSYVDANDFPTGANGLRTMCFRATDRVIDLTCEVIGSCTQVR
jgi:hypothetical protein